MFKHRFGASLLLLCVLTGALSFATSAPAFEEPGISVDQVYARCVFRDLFGGSVINRDDVCESYDTIVVDAWLRPGKWYETGFVTVTVSEDEGGRVVGVLRRPRFVQFSGLSPKRVQVQIKNVFSWSDNPEELFKVLAIQVTPVSAEMAAIVDDGWWYIGWKPVHFDSDGGKGVTVGAGGGGGRVEN